MQEIQPTTLDVLVHRCTADECVLITASDGSVIAQADAGKTITLAEGRRMRVGTRAEVDALIAAAPTGKATTESRL
jgi:hypothetical protein